MTATLPTHTLRDGRSWGVILGITLLARVTFCAVIFLLVGCGDTGGPQTPYRKGVTATTEKPTAFCLKDSNGQYVDSPNRFYNFSKGSAPKQTFRIVDEREGYEIFSAVGGGCVHRPIRELWAVLQNEPALQWSESDSDGMRPVPSADAAFVFETQYRAGPSWNRKMVNWVVEWDHYLDVGTLLEPEYLKIDFQKTLGTKYIVAFGGTIHLQKLSDQVTAYMMDMQETGGKQISSDNAYNAVNDILGKLKTALPNWKYLDSEDEDF